MILNNFCGEQSIKVVKKRVGSTKFQKECWKAYSEGKMEFFMLQLEVEKPMQYGEVLSKNH